MFLPLSSWLKRTHSLPSRFYDKGHIDTPSEDWSVWVELEEMKPIYLVTEMNWLSLKDSREKTKDYLENASEIINGLEGGWLNSEERMWILEKLGEPPLPCLPIYLMTYGDGSVEKLVYVGKTKSSSRFSGGHTAALKLHNPRYDNRNKRVYRCSVWFHFNEEYIALDWIQPETLALKLLDSVESQLIFHFQPELNTNKKSKNNAEWIFYIHIQNFLVTGFLNDTFV